MMNAERIPDIDEPTQMAVNELEEMITKQYPNAAFQVAHGEDPEGVYLKATVDIEDVDEVLDVVSDRLFAIQVEQGLPLYVIPLQPVERVMHELQSTRRLARPKIEWGPVLPLVQP